MSSQKRSDTEAVRTDAENAGTNPPPPKSARAKRILKWIAVVVGLIFFVSVFREALNPFGSKPYLEISHGDHVHYVPKNRDTNVPVGRFPTTEPGPDERITPDGRIVKKSPPDSTSQ